MMYRLARSKAYLFKGVEIRWSCDRALLKSGDETPDAAVLHYPGGLADFLSSAVGKRATIGNQTFSGDVERHRRRAGGVGDRLAG